MHAAAIVKEHWEVLCWGALTIFRITTGTGAAIVADTRAAAWTDTVQLESLM